MTNTIAIWLGIVIVGLIGLDIWLETGLILIVARRFAWLVEYVAFWR